MFFIILYIDKLIQTIQFTTIILNILKAKTTILIKKINNNT